MTVAEYFADRLRKLGVKYVFGIPGGSTIPYIEAYRKAGIEYILVSHEASAGVMAAVTARITGVPGVCHATFGPGATNLSTGVGGAFLDRSPVLAVTDEIGEDMIGRTVQMNIDHQKLFAPITKATFRLNTSYAPEIIERAASICIQEYPGPVHLGFPSNIAQENIETIPEGRSASHSSVHAGNESAVLSLLNKSRLPLLVIGLTSARLLSPSILSSLLDRLRIPVLVTPMAKGMIPEDHPCYAGVLFHALSGHLTGLINESDLVIGLGYDPVEYNYESWLPDVPLLHLNTIQTDLPSHGEVVEYTGNPEEWLAVLDRALPDNIRSRSESIILAKERIASDFNRFTDRFGPVTVLKVLREELPPDVILTADVGSHLHLIGQYWNTGSMQTLLMTNGWSGMGFGIPAALAVKLSRPWSTVASVVGDGGFLMTAGEIITARRYNLPVVIVVLSDGELNLIRLKKSWQNLSPYGTSLYSGDLFGADTFLGIPVIDARSGKEMIKAVRSALKNNGPVIINACIDPEDYNYLISGRS